MRTTPASRSGVQRQSCATGRAANSRIACPANSFGSSSSAASARQLVDRDRGRARGRRLERVGGALLAVPRQHLQQQARDALLVAAQDEPRRRAAPTARKYDSRHSSSFVLVSGTMPWKKPFGLPGVEIDDEPAFAEQRRALVAPP